MIFSTQLSCQVQAVYFIKLEASMYALNIYLRVNNKYIIYIFIYEIYDVYLYITWD